MNHFFVSAALTRQCVFFARDNHSMVPRARRNHAHATTGDAATAT